MARYPTVLRFDLLRAPLIGRFLRWRHARTTLQAPLLLVAAILLYDGFWGPQLAPQNIAGVLPWVQWRGLLALALLIGGNFFCMACPFMLPRRLAKVLLPAKRAWPRRLRSKWLAAGLLVVFFWAYEAFALWASPWLTAWVVLAYFVSAFVIDGFFKGAAFCKYVCPIGQFNFISSLVSPLEVAVREPTVCATCATKDCIVGHPRGTRPQNGCELWLFQPRKAGNLDCTFCLDCIQACPHGNVGILARMPGRELAIDPRRSGVGHFSTRADLAALALIVVFAAFLNAFSMVEPFQTLAQWLAQTFGIGVWGVLALFGMSFVALPLGLATLTAWASRRLSGGSGTLVAVATRYSYGLVPIGFGMWLAHYGFHFMTGALTIVPVVQSFVADLGAPLLGAPRWNLGQIMPSNWLIPIEILCLEAGLIVSWLASYRIAIREHDAARHARRAFIPWAVLIGLLFGLGVWLMLQPMQMRGMLGG
jgi:ferredoxin